MGWRVTSGAVCLQAVEVIQELRRKESQLKRKKRRLRRRRDEYLWSVAPSAGERQKDSGGSCDPDSVTLTVAWLLGTSAPSRRRDRAMSCSRRNYRA